MSNLALSSQLWASALSLDAYVEKMSTYRDRMRQRLAYVRLTPADRATFGSLQQVRYALVMTEDWCGDALLNLPIIARIVEALPQAELRIVYRAANETLDAHYGARDIVNIPVLTFFDEACNELGTWVERPQVASEQFEAWKAARPEFITIRHATDLAPEERTKRLAPFYAQLLDDMFVWYDSELNLQQATVNEISDLLTNNEARL